MEFVPQAYLCRFWMSIALEGVGLQISGQKNVIIRNMKIGKVLAAYGDAIRILESVNVWVDHCDLYGDRSVGKDTYDGLVDLSHGADWVTISHTYFHDHVRSTPLTPTWRVFPESFLGIEH